MLEITREDFFYDTEVLARNHLENRGFFRYQCQVEDWLKQHDDNLEVWKNERRNKYRIVTTGYHTIMEIDSYKLNYGIVEHIKRIDSHRGYSAAKEMDDADERVKQANDKRMEDLAYNLAKDTRKHVANL